MKNKLPIYWHVLAVFILIFGIIFYYSNKHEKVNINNFLSSNIYKKCIIDTDCKTPGEYMIRSNCSFTSKCINNRCNVVCIGSYKTKEEELNKIPQCSRNEDCDCSLFYKGTDIFECSCIDKLCIAIIE